MQKADTISPPVTSTKQKSWKSLLIYYWLLSRWLSLDVAIGAVISSSMACKLLGVSPLPLSALAILGITVWVIYTLDHVWDVRNSNGVLVSSRRLFHWQYRKELSWIAALLSGLLGIGIWIYLPFIIIFFGIGLGSLVAVYLWMVNKLGLVLGKRVFHKELIVAFLYTSGVWGIAFLYAGWLQVVLVHICMCLLFSLLAFQNLLLFSLYEYTEDFQQAQRSMVQTYGIKKVKIVVLSLFSLFAVVAIFTASISRTSIAQYVLSTLVIMNLLLVLLFAFPRFFSRYKIYRPIGDGVFLLPGWLLFI